MIAALLVFGTKGFIKISNKYRQFPFSYATRLCLVPKKYKGKKKKIFMFGFIMENTKNKSDTIKTSKELIYFKLFNFYIQVKCPLQNNWSFLFLTQLMATSLRSPSNYSFQVLFSYSSHHCLLLLLVSVDLLPCLHRKQNEDISFLFKVNIPLIKIHIQMKKYPHDSCCYTTN